MLLLSQSDQLVALNDLYTDLGDEHDGWLDAVNTLMTQEDFGGSIYGIPYAASGINILYRRYDALSAAGYEDAPETWEEVSEMSAAAQNPPENYGMGFALSNVGDGNLTTVMLQSWGGRVADDEGKTCTIDSEETRAFMEWITTAFNDGLFPPGATTWDGAGDNTAYQAGNALFIANPGSVYLGMRDNDPELLEASRFSGLPGGPVMRLVPVSTEVRAIPATTSSEKQEMALDLFAFLADDEFMAAYMSAAIFGPALQSQVDFPVFSESPVHIGLEDSALNGTPAGFPDVNNAAFAEYQTNFLTPRMVQRVVVDGLSIDDAVVETQEACQAIYDKYE
jgi:multiple sugar transport system substrate-binding protein